MPVINPDTAAVDIGSTEMFACVPENRDPQPIRRFGAFTEDLYALSAWFKGCGIKTVALESTGVYWIPLYQILESAGFEVYLSNARALKNVSGRKTDVGDSQWLQFLHSIGLIRTSFRPPQQVCAVRSILRHRDSLIEQASMHTQHIQKALVQMNLQIHHVISDIMGVTGLAILDAMLAGERNPHVLAELRDRRIKKPKEIIEKSLVGDWRDEHLFTLRQSLDLYRYCHLLIAQCDQQIEQMLAAFDSQIDTKEHPIPKSIGTNAKPYGNQIRLTSTDLRSEMYRIFGTDLTQTPGIGPSIAHGLFAELGADLSAFRDVKCFTSWMGLCPDNRISGGKILSAHTRDVKNHVANLFRLAAQSVQGMQCYLGEYYRRMRARFGPAKANTATAHKIARIIYHLITTKEQYDEEIFHNMQEQYLQRKTNRIIREASKLGVILAPTATQLS